MQRCVLRKVSDYTRECVVRIVDPFTQSLPLQATLIWTPFFPAIPVLFQSILATRLGGCSYSKTPSSRSPTTAHPAQLTTAAPSLPVRAIPQATHSSSVSSPWALVHNTVSYAFTLRSLGTTGPGVEIRGGYGAVDQCVGREGVDVIVERCGYECYAFWGLIRGLCGR